MAVALYRVPTSNNTQYTLNTQLVAGGVTAVLSQDVSAIVRAPGVFVVDRVDASGNKTPAVREYISFTGVSTNTLTGLSKGLGGSTDQVHNVGAIVEFVPDVVQEDQIYQWATVEHLTNGTHSATMTLPTTVVTLTGTQTLTNKTLTSPTVTSPTTTGTDSGTQTLVNKTLTKPTINGQIYGATAVSGTTPTLDCTSTSRFTITLSGNTTFAISNVSTNQVIIVEVKQGTGTTYTNTWFTGITWVTSGGTAPVQTTTSNGITTYGFICTGTNTYNGYLVGTN